MGDARELAGMLEHAPQVPPRWLLNESAKTLCAQADEIERLTRERVDFAAQAAEWGGLANRQGLTMHALATKVREFLHLREKSRPDPEPVFRPTRPMTGFFSSLSAEQKKRALAYRGDDHHGDPAFPKAPQRA